jgi:elongation factor Ts
LNAVKERINMPEITAAMVKALRDKTDLPMMDCKAALVEVGGDEAKAIELLQRKARGKLVTKADRETAEGRIGICIAGPAGAAGIVELRCETAAVAQNQVFAKLADDIARIVAGQPDATPSAERVLSSQGGAGRTVQDMIGDVFGKLGENMKIQRARKLKGSHFGSYLHHDSKTGVVVAYEGEPTSEDVVKDLCMHAAFTKPAGITREDIPRDQVEKVRALAVDLAREEGKPDKIIDKIADGKVNAWFSEKVLMEQEHVKVTKTRVRDVLKKGGITAVTDLAVFVVGA